MSPEEDGLSGQDAELSELLRDALRARTPEGLSEAQHAVLLAAGRSGARPGHVARGALLALACALPLAFYLVSARPAKPEAVVVPRAVPVVDDRPGQAELEAAREQALRQAREAEDARERARRVERAAMQTEDEASAARAASQSAGKGKLRAATRAGKRGARAATAGLEETDAGSRTARSRSVRPAAKGGPGGAVKATASCDPDDALCGL
jgi:hypothetical protein